MNEKSVFVSLVLAIDLLGVGLSNYLPSWISMKQVPVDLFRLLNIPNKKPAAVWQNQTQRNEW